MPAIRDFVEYIKSLDNFKTTFAENSRSGISISYKTAKN